MRTVFGIDVSKATSEVAILVNGERVHGYSIPNDVIGFSRLFHDLTQVVKPEIIFEATGVYSRRLEAFLKNTHFLNTIYFIKNDKCELFFLLHNQSKNLSHKCWMRVFIGTTATDRKHN